MSISLNDHENRIVELEKRKVAVLVPMNDSRFFPFVVNATYTLLDNVRNYDLLICNYVQNDNSNTVRNFASSLILVSDWVAGRIAEPMSAARWLRFQYVSDTTFKILLMGPVNSSDGSINPSGSAGLSIYGLKLYYNFSYNIYACVINMRNRLYNWIFRSNQERRKTECLFR